MPKSKSELFKVENQTVFFQGEPTGMDMLTFRVLYLIEYLQEFHIEAGYVQDLNAVYWFDQRRKNLLELSRDVAGFRIINDDFAVDCISVFQWERRISNSHGPSFTLLTESPYYSKDKNQVYYFSSNPTHPELIILKNVDSSSFMSLGWNEFGTDRDNLFYLGKIDNESKYERVPFLMNPAKPEMHTEWSKDSRIRDFIQKHSKLKGYWWSANYDKKPQDCHRLKYTYWIGENAVYTVNDYGTPLLLFAADTKTFQVINQLYSKDAVRVFYLEKRIEGADAKTFTTIDRKFPMYAGDKDTVYYKGSAIDHADARSFKVVNDMYAKDRNTVYAFGSKMKNSHPSSFRVVGSKFAKDKSNVYCEKWILAGADPASFEHLFTDEYDISDWAKDKKRLYNANGRRTFPGIDGGSFQVLNRFYGKDKKSIFSFKGGRIIKEADPGSFRVTDAGGGAEDKNFLYLKGKKSKRK